MTAPGRAGPRRTRPRPLLRALLAGVLGTFVALPLPGVASAQDGSPFSLSVHGEDGSLAITIGDLFRDQGLVRAIHAGLPLRIQLRAELWKDGFFDSQRGSGEWRASVLFDPLEGRYRVATGVEGSAELTADSLGAVVEALQAGFSLPLGPVEAGKYYYLAQVQMETLSLTDLGELQRWLRGDLAPAVRGERSPGTAVGRGVHRMVVRMLGIPARRYRMRTEAFRFEGGSPD